MTAALAVRDEAAEAGVVGACLRDSEALKQAVASLTAADFWLESHRTIFRAISALHHAGEPVDLVTVSSELAAHGGQAAPRAADLADLVDSVPTVAHLPNWIRSIQEAALRRRLSGLGAGLVERVKDLSNPLASLLADFTADLSDLRRSAPGRAEAVDPAILESPLAVLHGLRESGAILPSGLPRLDDLLRGGFRPGRLVVVAGTTGGGKSTLLDQIGLTLATTGTAVALLAPDEGRAPAVVRVGQQFGLGRDYLEVGEEASLAAFRERLAGLALYLPPSEIAAEDVLEALASVHPAGTRALLVDSLHTCTTRLPDCGSLRETLMARARLLRRLAEETGSLVVVTSETNRANYRSRKENERSAEISAPAEARIEFVTDVLLTIRGSEQELDLAEVRVVKNRLGRPGSFLLRLDRQRARFLEVSGDPGADVSTQAAGEAVRRVVERILAEVRRHPGLNRSALGEAVGGKKATFNQAVLQAEEKGWLRHDVEGRSVRYYLTGGALGVAA